MGRPAYSSIPINIEIIYKKLGIRRISVVFFFFSTRSISKSRRTNQAAFSYLCCSWTRDGPLLDLPDFFIFALQLHYSTLQPDMHGPLSYTFNLRTKTGKPGFPHPVHPIQQDRDRVCCSPCLQPQLKYGEHLRALSMACRKPPMVWKN
mgnify:CR=1 FL=1